MSASPLDLSRRLEEMLKVARKLLKKQTEMNACPEKKATAQAQ